MLRRMLKEVDASDILIAGALLGLGLAVTVKADVWIGLGVVSVAILGLISLTTLATR